jgi:VIT1/CCC1 family predicted Fe2+/Mn2+ transporter
MNIILWVLQAALAVKFASVAYTHGLRPAHPDMQRGQQRFGTAARPLLIVIALCTFLGALGLVLPAAIGTLAWLTPWAAALLALMMPAAAGLHLACREKPKTAVSLVLLVLAAVVAVGRQVITPV